MIPREWLAQLPGLALTCLHVAMLETRPAQTRDYEFASLSQHFHRDANVMGCTVDQGRFRVYSDWRTHGDGFGRMLVHGMPDDDTPNQRTAAGEALGGTSRPRRHTMVSPRGGRGQQDEPAWPGCRPCGSQRRNCGTLLHPPAASIRACTL